MEERMPYRYSTPPNECRCGNCGYTLEMKGEYEGLHCPDVACPSCGGRLWRVKR